MNLKANNLGSNDSISDEEVKANPGRVVELLTCPFCDANPHLIACQSRTEDAEIFTISCNNLKCVVSISTRGTDLEALTRLWNTRLGRGSRTVRVRVELVAPPSL